MLWPPKPGPPGLTKSGPRLESPFGTRRTAISMASPAGSSQSSGTVTFVHCDASESSHRFQSSFCPA